MALMSDNEFDAMSLAYNITKFVDVDYLPVLTLQSMTVVCKYDGVINLAKLSTQIPNIFELELFPVLTITKYKPISVTVFSTGSITICGVKDFERVDSILNEISPLLALSTIP